MSDSVRPHRWQPTRLSRPWHSPGKNTGVGCHFLLQRMKVKLLSCVQLVGLQPTRLLRPWDFLGQEYWSGLLLPSPERECQKPWHTWYQLNEKWGEVSALFKDPQIQMHSKIWKPFLCEFIYMYLCNHNTGKWQDYYFASHITGFIFFPLSTCWNKFNHLFCITFLPELG